MDACRLATIIPSPRALHAVANPSVSLEMMQLGAQYSDCTSHPWQLHTLHNEGFITAAHTLYRRPYIMRAFVERMTIPRADMSPSCKGAGGCQAVRPRTGDPAMHVSGGGSAL